MFKMMLITYLPETPREFLMAPYFLPPSFLPSCRSHRGNIIMIARVEISVLTTLQDVCYM